MTVTVTVLRANLSKSANEQHEDVARAAIGEPGFERLVEPRVLNQHERRVRVIDADLKQSEGAREYSQTEHGRGASTRTLTSALR